MVTGTETNHLDSQKAVIDWYPHIRLHSGLAEPSYDQRLADSHYVAIWIVVYEQGLKLSLDHIVAYQPALYRLVNFAEQDRIVAHQVGLALAIAVQ